MRQNSVAEDKKIKYRLSKGLKNKQPTPQGKKRAPKSCSKCKNHNVHEIMSIRHVCRFAECVCEACKITHKRRGHVKTDVTNIRRNQNTNFITPPSTPESFSSQSSSGSFSAQSSPASGIVTDAEAVSPLRFDAATQEEFFYDASMLSPADSPADRGVQSPVYYLSSAENDLFAPDSLPAMSPPSATLVQHDFEMSTSFVDELRTWFEPQNHTFGELLGEATLELTALPESLQQEIQEVCMQSKKNDFRFQKICSYICLFCSIRPGTWRMLKRCPFVQIKVSLLV